MSETTVRDLHTPGIYRGVPFGEYLAIDAINNSSLAPMVDGSPAHYQWAQRHPRESTRAMSLGTYIHAAALEPATYRQKYVTMPDLTPGCKTTTGNEPASRTSARSTHDYKRKQAAWLAEQNKAGREVVGEADLDALIGAMQAIDAAGLASRLARGHAEVTLVWVDLETGLLCKCRIDSLHAGEIIDLKTSGQPLRQWCIVGSGTARQMAFYSGGLRVLTGEGCKAWVALVEQQGPWGIDVRAVSPEAIEAGREHPRLGYRPALRTIAECRATGQWPGYPVREEWECPGWAMTDSEATAGGMPVAP